MDINEERLHHPENDPAYLGLKVNQGVTAQPMVNPNLRRIARRTYTVDEFVEGILRSDITCLSQAVTLVESNRPDHQAIAQQIIERCLPYSGKSMRVGITGVPGAGKSTSIDTFGMHLVKQGRRLAVLAIDPSSERSGGSILGDKTRMEQLSREKSAFIRPSPTAALSVAWHVRLERRSSSAKQQALIRSLLRPLGLDRVRRPYTRWSTSSFSSSLQAQEMSSRGLREVSWRWLMRSSSTKLMVTTSIRLT